MTFSIWSGVEIRAESGGFDGEAVHTAGSWGLKFNHTIKPLERGYMDSDCRCLENRFIGQRNLDLLLDTYLTWSGARKKKKKEKSFSTTYSVVFYVEN